MSSRDPPRLRRGSCVLLAVAAGTLLAPECAAQARLSMDAESNLIVSDNPFLIDGDDTGAIAGEIVAKPRLDWTLAPGTSLDVDLAIGLRQFHRRYGNFLIGRADTTLRHRDSEYLTVLSALSYARELSTEALADGIDSAIDPRGVISTYLARSSVTWNPNARTAVVGDLVWQRSRRPDSIVPTATTRELRLEVSKRVSALTSLGIQTQLTMGDSGPRGESMSQALRFTLSRRMRSNWRADLQLGIERLEEPRSASASGEAHTNFSGGGTFCYEPRLMVACVRGSLRSGISGLGGLQRELAFSGSLTRRISERETITADAEYRRSRLGVLDSSADVLRVAATYGRRVTERLWLTGGADYLRRTGIEGRSLSAAVVRIGVTFEGLFR